MKSFRAQKVNILYIKEVKVGKVSIALCRRRLIRCHVEETRAVTKEPLHHETY